MTLRIDVSTLRHAYVPAEIKRPASQAGASRPEETDARTLVRMENQRVAQNRPEDALAAARLAAMVRDQLAARPAIALRAQAQQLDVQKVASLLD